ncbi:Rv1733c family protein [Pseudonocardia lacus]|uniref:Rv1733c family protein n=1 Tax=Pseudonocardia lacus TaxID=2835865 RepID=UPI001BDBF876|nr:hypothetical protein [Pseudonocardia lacus]
MDRRSTGRPDRLPRRGTDRLEDAAAWLLMIAGLLLVVLAVTAALGVGASATARARAETAERVEVPATVLRDAPEVAVLPGAGLPRVLTDVTWTEPDGTSRTGAALAPALTRAGQPVTVWLDRSGQPVDEPFDEASAGIAAVAVCVFVLMAGAVVLTTAWIGVRHGIAVLNGRGWEREWERVGPEWTGHGRQDAGRSGD